MSNRGETSPLLSHYHLLMSSTTTVPFMVKQPSVLPRILCASHCPPHNVEHEIEQYLLYYDPLYFPNDYQSVFSVEQSVCDWLLKSLHTHALSCQTCPKASLVFNEKTFICSRVSFFDCTLYGVHLHFSLAFVESPVFSFCRLQHQFHLLMSRVPSLMENVDELEWSTCQKKRCGIPHMVTSRERLFEQVFIFIIIAATTEWEIIGTFITRSKEPCNSSYSR